MSVVEKTVELPDISGPAVDAAYDVSGRRMATCVPSSSGSIVQVYECASGPDSWSQVAAWETDLQVNQLTWAHPEYGRVLAGGTTSGSLLVWGQVPEVQPGGGAVPGAGGGIEDANGGGGGAYYQPLADLSCGTAPCRALCFAPRQSGLLLAALLDDGHVVVHVADEVLAPRAWSLHSKIRAGPRDHCGGLCWRPFSPGVPPMLCVGSGPHVLVWQYVLAMHSWQIVARIETGNGQHVSTLHWATPLGRPVELLAVGSGRDLLIYSLSGDTSALKVEQLEALEHDDAVWKVEWDLWGNQVAAATEGQEVHVYKPNLVGEWVELAWVRGREPEEQ
ncbi:hypothetical protein VOLCADRAFT_110056 [Volvox carteri f. nagariensis]|uniref:Uncharacterized protein n=1 Tax=Volvox carteri f. nagariensis TaxID=3068 RepID=D8UEY0_VOLCA|nr:uncharacterized protein VOLCADRAFT_110056 [Volvox carteri f. nagariensis]EFJ41721.1 hypothetical protein VOLCADRAFT_110056 [Volvox carteri f. nagariensis]|eukprot:XP_002957223.1 hypothetical protein VOLCADRAFT_110056 [Volvox carteri f. nagariensis]